MREPRSESNKHNAQSFFRVQTRKNICNEGLEKKYGKGKKIMHIFSNQKGEGGRELLVLSFSGGHWCLIRKFGNCGISILQLLVSSNFVEDLNG